MELYVNAAATTSRAVLAFCKVANITVEVKSVDLMHGEHLGGAFAALNPNCLVPVLVDEDFVLTESSAILKYLARKFRSPLYPDDLRVQARIDERIAWLESNFLKDFGHQYVYPQFLPHHARATDEATRLTIEWGRKKSCEWLRVLDAHVLGDGQNYLAGDAVSIADLFGASILSLGEIVGSRFEAFPNVRRWYEHVTSQPSWLAINGTFEQFAASLRELPLVRLSA